MPRLGQFFSFLLSALIAQPLGAPILIARPLAKKISLLALAALLLLSLSYGLELRMGRARATQRLELAELWSPAGRALLEMSINMDSIAAAMVDQELDASKSAALSENARDLDAMLLRLHGLIERRSGLNGSAAIDQLSATVDALRAQNVDLRLALNALVSDDSLTASTQALLSRELWVMQRRVSELRQLVSQREHVVLLGGGGRRGQSLILAVDITALILIGWALFLAVAALNRAKRLNLLASDLPESRATLDGMASRGDELGAVATSLGKLVDTMAERDRVLRRQHDELERAYRERITAQRALVEAERLAAIGEMSSRITHEIRNPLASISLNVDMLREELELLDKIDPELLELVGAIEREIQRLTNLAEGYLRASRPSRGLPRVLNLAAALDDLIRQYRPRLDQQGASISALLDEDAQIYVDTDELRQILLNLLQNALEAVAHPGERERKIEIRAHSEGDKVVCVFDDDGPGIDPDMMEQLFEPFASSRRGGTGLGLAISRQLVLAQGGELEAMARGPLGGARFRISWPQPSASAVSEQIELIS